VTAYMRDDDPVPNRLFFTIAAVVIIATAFGMLVWSNLWGRLDEVPPESFTGDSLVGSQPADRGEIEAVSDGWPRWPSKHVIHLYALAYDADASSMAVERQPDGRIVVTNPPEAPLDESVWDRLSLCESGGDWHINTGNGFSGGLQWHPDTWRRAGGHEYAPHAWQATREQEIAVAEAWLARTSWSQWPACSRALGLMP
jgi:hypothetical protein